MGSNPVQNCYSVYNVVSIIIVYKMEYKIGIYSPILDMGNGMCDFIAKGHAIAKQPIILCLLLSTFRCYVKRWNTGFNADFISVGLLINTFWLGELAKNQKDWVLKRHKLSSRL